MNKILISLFLATACGACNPTSGNLQSGSDAPRLPTGARLDPAGVITDVGTLPLAMVPSPDGRQLVLLLSGYRDQGVQIVDRGTGRIIQTLIQPAAFLGIAFAPDGRRLYASGGNEDLVYVYDWRDGAATLVDSLVLATKQKGKPGTRYPAGIGMSPDGKLLYVAENLADSLAVIDLATGRVLQRFAAGRYPYGVAVAGNGSVYVSTWGGTTVSEFVQRGNRLESIGTIEAGRHPSALILNGDGSRLFVASATTDKIAVIDTRRRTVIATLSDAAPTGPGEGSTPNALALSVDGRRLYIAEGDNNAVGVIELSAQSSGVASATGNDRISGRIPAGWYPSALTVTRDSLFVANAKGRGTAPNPDGPNPAGGRGDARNYTLGQLSGTLMRVNLPDVTSMARFTERVTRANGWNSRAGKATYPPIEHVVYIIKENRTYDQVFGDLTQADGDTSLLFFPRAVSPNHHALAERFGIFDRFFVNAEASPDGHNWSTAAYTSDYLQKTMPSNYSSRGRSYDYEGTNRGAIPDDDVAEPGSGYLWNLAEKAGITFRNYGEFVIPLDFLPDGSRPPGYQANKPYLATHTNTKYPGYSLEIPDQVRADVWIADMEQFERDGSMPALEIVRLPNDHTAGARAGSPTPHAYMADNDLALGRMIEALSKTRFWKSTAVFVVEDDAQNGSDHVDSHRSLMLVISPWAKGGVMHRFTNTTDVIATIEELLGLEAMSQFDYFGRPLRDIWSTRPDVRPYVALRPSVPLDQLNPRVGIGAEESRKLALAKEDMADEDLFNTILWRAIKGESRPWPGVKRASSLDLIDSRAH